MFREAAGAFALTPSPHRRQTERMTKGEIRELMRSRRAQLDAAARQASSQAIAATLASLPVLAGAAEIACYLSLPAELAMADFIAACHRRGTRVCVPAWHAADKTYRLVRCAPDEPLVSGPFQVLEPAQQQPVPPAAVQAVVLPGLAFDRRGGRLGYGGGHYDRLLAACAPDVLKIGVCCAWQVVDDDLPLTEHDVRVNLLVTDQGVVDCAGPGA